MMSVCVRLPEEMLGSGFVVGFVVQMCSALIINLNWKQHIYM